MESQKGTTITIEDSKKDGTLTGYLSRPSSSEKRPGMIIIHEWWGLVPDIKNVADRYASQGYVALAPDLYGGRIANDTENARKLSSSVSTDASSMMIDKFVEYLRKDQTVSHDKIGITGFCFGGTHSFHFVCVSRKIAAGAIYYASRLPTENLLERITSPLLLIYGDQDHSINPEQARGLESTLKRMGKQSELLIYPDCPHAFFNEHNMQNHRPDAARDAWNKTLAFFETHLH